MFRALFLVIVLALLSGCVTPVYQTLPVEMRKEHSVILVRSKLLDQTDHTLMHINESKNVLYFQNYGGGGATLGVLLGPIGVLANTAAIESNTKDDVKLLSGKTGLDPNELFKDIVKNAGFSIVEKSSVKPRLTPYILVSKGENEILYFASALIVEYGDDSSNNKWFGRYMYLIDASSTKDAVANGLSDGQHASLRSKLRKGFEVLASIYRKDIDGVLVDGSEITLKSEFLSPRFNLELYGKFVSEDFDRVVIRTAGAIFSLPKQYVAIAKSNAENK